MSHSVWCSVLLLAALVDVGPLREPPSGLYAAKYQSVFYPNGLPSKKGWDGTDRPTVYHWYADVELPKKDAAVVLFAEEAITGSSDNLFTLFLGLVQTRNGVSTARARVELTEYIPVQLEEPGNLHHVAGAVNRFQAAPNVTAVHVNVWGVLSGTGSIGGGSDLFFEVDEAKAIFRPLLLLANTSRFSRQGPDRYAKKNVMIHLADLDRDATLEVIVNRLEMQSGDAGGTADLRSVTAEVYKLNGGRYRLDHAIAATSLPTTAVLLKRSEEIAQIIGR